MKEMITVEKEVYEAVLRNSVRVTDLEAENQRLREMVLNDVTMERADKIRAENQQLKELLRECRDDVNHIISKVHLCKELLDLKTKIDNAIGEKK